MAPQKDAVARFRAAGEKIVALHPEFAVLWFRVRGVTVDSSVPTCAVDSRWNVRVNGDFVLGLPEKELLFVCAHEVFHPVLQHFSRAKALNVKSAEEVKTWNIAADMAINHAIKEGLGLSAPSYALFPPHGYTGDIDAESLYKHLLQNLYDKPESGDRPGEGCGTEAPEDVDAREGEGGEEIDAQVAAEILRGMGNSRLARALKPPTRSLRNWEKLLRAAFSGGNFKRGYAHSSYARPRHQGGLLLPRYRKTTPSVAVVIDTSGSMGDDTLSLIVDETLRLACAYPGISVLLVTHTDTVNFVGRITSATSTGQIKKACAYTGGTYAAPAYEAVKAETGGRVDWLVHFTDCEIERKWPTVPAKRLFVGDFGHGGTYATKPPKGARVLKCR